MGGVLIATPTGTKFITYDADGAYALVLQFDVDYCCNPNTLNASELLDGVF